MRTLSFAVTVLACLMIAGPASSEYRAFWADGFTAGFYTPEQVDTLISRLKESNCNSIWPQMRKSGDAHYRSTYEPWARQNPQHFDALADILEKAHAASPPIEVHAWINTCAVGGHLSPDHILNAHPDYTSISDAGVAYDNEAMKIDPGNPGAADWTFRVYLDVARHYNVDGIHFDFVRHGNAHWGYNPQSVALFNKTHKRSGKPAFDDPEWQQWRRDQVTNLVRKVYAHSKALKPGLKVSAATICWGDGPQSMDEWKKSSSYKNIYQDWRSWMEEGILDINCPMTYFSNQRHRDYWLHWTAFAKDNRFNRQLVIGSGIWLNSIPDTFQQIRDTREITPAGGQADGVLLYSYAGTNAASESQKPDYNPEFYSALSKASKHGDPPFSEPSSIPAPRAKRKAIVKGFVLTDPWLAPVVGAKVRLSGSGGTREMTTDVTGFYAFIDAPAGEQTLEVSMPGFKAQKAALRIADGPQILTANRYLTSAARPSGLISDKWIVSGGDNAFRDTLYLWNPWQQMGRKVPIAKQPLPFQPGDRVAVADLPGGLAPAVRLIGIDEDLRNLLPPGETMPIAGLSKDGCKTGQWVRLSGTAKSLETDGFVLSDGASDVQISARDLRDGRGFTVGTGEQLEVTGIVDKEGGLRVCPTGPDDIVRKNKA